MAQDKFADWKSKAEAAQILRCSHKTIERLAGQNKIQKHMRRIPGRRSTPVYHPDDIEALRNDTANLEPFPMDAAARQAPPTEALLPATAAQARAGDIFLHLLNSGLPGRDRRATAQAISHLEGSGCLFGNAPWVVATTDQGWGFESGQGRWMENPQGGPGTTTTLRPPLNTI